MKSRVFVGVALLAAVGTTVAGAAGAQKMRSSGLGQLFERARDRAAKPADPRMTRITRPGDYRFTFTHGGVSRLYLVHVPRSYDPRRPASMLVALHGGGGDADYQADDAKYRLITKSEQAGFIAVFPNGYSRFKSGVLATWNAGTCCGGAVRNRIDDVGFLREVILRVERQANIDRRRVFMTGMSNGGLMSYRMACEASDVVRAIAPVAGTDNTLNCRPSRPVPVIHFHARNDDHVPFGGGTGDKAVSGTDFRSVATTIAKWVGLNHADRKARRVVTVPGAHCERYPGPAPVELCVTDTGGHSWPGGGTQQGRKQPSMAISANDRMWAFFSSL